MRFGELRRHLGLPVLLGKTAKKQPLPRFGDTCTQQFIVIYRHGEGYVNNALVAIPNLAVNCITDETGKCSIDNIPAGLLVTGEVIAKSKDGKMTFSPKFRLTTCIENPKELWIGMPGPCFIATAAYGTPLHEDIDILRKFRNEHLLTNPFGRIFTKTYYMLSPSFANIITQREILRAAVRKVLIAPIVRYLRRKEK